MINVLDFSARKAVTKSLEQTLSVQIVKMVGAVRDEDYKVLTKSYIDDRGKEYLSGEDFGEKIYLESAGTIAIDLNEETLEAGIVDTRTEEVISGPMSLNEAIIMKMRLEDECVEQQNIALFVCEDEFDQSLVFSFEKAIDMNVAKKCGLGVIEILSGKYKGQCFLYPILGIHLEAPPLELFAYSVLAHGFITEQIREIFRDECNQMLSKVVLFEEAYNELQMALAN